LYENKYKLMHILLELKLQGKNIFKL